MTLIARVSSPTPPSPSPVSPFSRPTSPTTVALAGLLVLGGPLTLLCGPPEAPPGAGAGANAGSKERVLLAPPDAAAQSRAEKTVRSLFAKEYSQKAQADRQVLATKLLARAEESRDAEIRFVLLREARDVAASAAAVSTGTDAIDRMARGWKIEGREMKLSFLAAVAKGGGGGSSLARAWLSLLREAIDADDYGLAGKAAGPAIMAAKASKDASLIKEAESQAGRARTLEKEYAATKRSIDALKARPDDTEACLAVGRFLCLVKGDWEKGLRLLARSSSPELKAAASKDVGAPSEAKARCELGDSWWDLAKKEKEGSSAARKMKERAAQWYVKSLGGLEGFDRTLREHRIAEAEGKAAPEIAKTDAAGKGEKAGKAEKVDVLEAPEKGDPITALQLAGIRLSSSIHLPRTDAPYTLNGKVTVADEDASGPIYITICPGVEVVGGTLELGGKGHLFIGGTLLKPAVLRKLRIVQALGGGVTAQYAVFDRCTFEKGGGWFTNHSTKWELDACLLHQCRFAKLDETDYGIKLNRCTFNGMVFPEIEPRQQKSGIFDIMKVLGGEWDTIESCSFVACTVPPTVFWCAREANYWSCRFVGGKAFQSTQPLEKVAFVAETQGDPPQKAQAAAPPTDARVTVKYSAEPYPIFRFPGRIPIAEIAKDGRFQKAYGAGKKK